MSEQRRGAGEDSIGASEAFLAFQERLSRVAQVERPVLLIGERGTGKELAASRLHYLSSRWKEPLVTLNCAALTPSLITTELFGHEAGAFTGAESRRMGRFEVADQGSLFLDEIGNIPMEAQEKILRVVEYGGFERVGGTRSVQVDTRIIGATHRDLPAEAAAGRFKPDLLDRLSFEVLLLPPLRERQGDVALLTRHFALRMSLELGRSEPPEFGPDAMRALEAHPWQGNIRELKNVVERAVYRCRNDRILEIEFDPFRHVRLAPSAAPTPSLEGQPGPDPSPPVPHGEADLPLPEAVRRLELRRLGDALARTRHHQGRAAELLGLTYNQFRSLYRKHKKDLAPEA